MKQGKNEIGRAYWQQSPTYVNMGHQFNTKIRKQAKLEKSL